ncbi:TIM barrel protein, partial [Candidatus Dojkabacteria bacterium]|nr:TIM barrel protein [Candidatus Dojkabacteria bacterium]
VKPEQAPKVKELAVAEDVSLSVHGSYYVNLASTDKQKWHASIGRVAQAAKMGDACGARSVTFHSGFIQDKQLTEVFASVKEGMKEVLAEVKDLQIKISPELTGKPSQFGDLGDLIRLTKELREEGYANVGFCFDFAHKYARSNGKFNTYDEFMQILTQIAEGLGDDFLGDMHIHVSGIEYSPKGERNHLLYLPTYGDYQAAGAEIDGMQQLVAGMDPKRLQPNHFNWQDLFRALKKMNVGGYIVCESPILELDAVLMQNFYRGL